MKVKTDMEGEVAIIRLSGNLTGGPESDEVRGAIRRLLDSGADLLSALETTHEESRVP